MIAAKTLLTSHVCCASMRLKLGKRFQGLALYFADGVRARICPILPRIFQTAEASRFRSSPGVEAWVNVGKRARIGSVIRRW